MTKRIGIDVGGVIINSLRHDGTDTSFHGDNFMQTTAVDGAFEMIRKLVELYGAENIFIISKCGSVIEGKTREWLAGKHFFTYTGFNPENLFFCLKRADKAPIAKELGITDFIDDHPDVLEFMKGIVANLYLFGPQSDTTQDLDGLIVIDNWWDTHAVIVS